MSYPENAIDLLQRFQGLPPESVALNRTELAHLLGVSVGSVDHGLLAHGGPPSVRISARAPRWRLIDVIAWLDSLPKWEAGDGQ